MRRGLSSCRCSHVNPRRSITPGPKFSTRTSERSTSLRKISLPSSDFMLRVRLRLLQLSIVKYSESTSGRSRSWLRVTSPRPGCSILMTSAPIHARSCVQTGPAWTCVMSRTRTPSRAFATVIEAPSLRLHRLVHGARRERGRLHPHVDQRRLAALARALERRPDLARLRDLLAVAAEHLGELAVADVRQLVADVAPLLAVLLDLAVADLVHVRVVADDPDERQVEADRRVEVEAGEAERAVTEQGEDLAVRVGLLGADAERDADADRPERTRVHPQAGALRLHDAAGERDDVAAVADEPRVLGEGLVELVREAERVDRRRVLHEARQALLLQALLLGAQRLEPALALVALAAALGRLGDLAEDRAGVADEAEGDVAVLADSLVGHVDLDDLRLARQPLAVAHPEVERRADDEDHVRVVERVAAREVEVVRVARGQRAAGGAVHVRRDVELADELDGLLVAARRPDLRAEQDARALGVDEDLGEAVDVVRVADALRRGAVAARLAGDDGALDRHLVVQDVAADLEEDGPGRAGHRLAEGHRAHVGHALGRHDVRGELRDRLHDVDVGQVLEGAHLVLVQRALAADQQERALRAEGVGDAGDRVGRAGAGGDDRAARLAGDARVGVGGVGGDLLVADVDDLDALVDAAVVDVDDVAAAEGVDHVDPLGLQGLGDEVAAGDQPGLDGFALRKCGRFGCGGRRGAHDGGSPSPLRRRRPAGLGCCQSRWSTVRSTWSARFSAWSRTSRSASSLSRASSASMMCMWSTIERSARSSSPMVRPRIARTCTSRFWTSWRIIGDCESSMMRWWKRRLATEYSLRCERSSPSSNCENSVRSVPISSSVARSQTRRAAIDSSAAQTVIISTISALLLRTM